MSNLQDIRAEHAAIAQEIKALKDTQEAFVADILKDLAKLKDSSEELRHMVGSDAKTE